MRKILSVIGILFVVGCLLVPLASASVIASYTAGTWTYSAPLQMVHPTSSGTYVSAQGQVFNASATEYVYNVTVRLSKVAGTDGNISAAICSVQGLAGSRYFDALLETSDVISTDDIALTPNTYTFSFSGTTQLTQYTMYGIYLYVVDETNMDSSNYVSWSEATLSTAGTNVFHYHNGWDTQSTYEFYYVINGEVGAGTPTPTPTPAPSTSSTGDADMEALTAAILPFLVPLLVCLIPALLGYKFVGELGFFIGLNVGCILAYVTLSGTAYAFPLWGIILVGVMDVAVVLMRR